jgi:4-amino-4-deoxy-L-arabinose transferase-like glycosyltransferase
MTSSKQHRAIGVLLILLIGTSAAVLRASYNANTLILEPIRADAAYNLVYANNLIEDHVFSKDVSPDPVPDSYWAPGYPFFLAIIIKVTDLLSVDTYNAILFCQLILGVGTVFLTYLVGASFLPRYWSILPASLVAISPHLVSTASYVLTETLFCFLLILSLYAMVRALTNDRTYDWILAGLCFALTYLVNPVSLFLAPLLAAVMVFYVRRIPDGKSMRSLGYSTLILIVPMIIVAMAWSLRSTISVPADQPTASKRLLTNLTIGLYPDFHEKWRSSILEPGKKIVLPGVGVDDSYSAFFDELIANISRDPIGMLAWYWTGKPILLWDWDIRTGFGDIYIYRVEYSLYHTSIPAIVTYSLMNSLHNWILLGTLFGLVFLFSTGGKHTIVPACLYATLIYVSLVYVISQSEPRYSIPLRPELYLCFTYFLWQTSQWIARVRRIDQ